VSETAHWRSKPRTKPSPALKIVRSGGEIVALACIIA